MTQSIPKPDTDTSDARRELHAPAGAQAARARKRLSSVRGCKVCSFEGTLGVLASAAKLRAPVINLGIGTSQYPLSSDVPAPTIHFKDSMSYGPAIGDEALRQSICDLLERQHPGADVGPERVVITDGGSNALYLALMCLVRPGDEVLIPEVHYPSFRPLVEVVGARLRTWKLDEQRRPMWLSLSSSITDRTAAILVDSPSNPFGVRLRHDEYQTLASMGVPVVSDEVYAGVDHCPGGSILTQRGDHFMIGSFSKLFAMPGLRLGFLVAPEWAVDMVNKMRFALNIATAIPSQRIGAYLLDHADVVIPKHRDYLLMRRQRTIELCRETGLPLVNDGAGAAFYVCADIRPRGLTSVEFAKLLLNTVHVTVCPGADFVATGDPGFVRLNVAVDLEVLETGLRRVSDFFHAPQRSIGARNPAGASPVASASNAPSMVNAVPALGTLAASPFDELHRTADSLPPDRASLAGSTRESQSA